jgi:hypothetical protein
MATTPNYGWVTPAPTDFVTDLPADFEVFADAVDADLAGLLGGTTGQVLTKVSGADHDFAFATPAVPPAPSLNWTLLNTGGTALTGADTITVSGISNLDYLMIFVHAASTTTALDQILVRLNTDTGSNYRNNGMQITAGSSYAVSNFEPAGNFNSASTFFQMGQMANNAASVVSGYAYFSGCNSTGLVNYMSASSGNAGGSNGHVQRVMGGMYANAAPITSVSLYAFNNFDAGTLFVYGA